MPKTPPPSSLSLDEQIAELAQQRDIASLNGAKAIQAALKTGKVATLQADLQAILDTIPAETNIAQVTRNIMSVISMAHRLLDMEIPRIEALATPPEA